MGIQKAGIADKSDEILFGNFTNFSIIKMAWFCIFDFYDEKGMMMTIVTDFLMTHDKRRIAIITLNRPDALNALNLEMVAAIQRV